jgi:hypothetical protein
MNAIPPTALRPGSTRHDWTQAEIEALLALPFPDLLFQAQSVHRAHHDPRRVQISTLLSIKTGGCPEDCAYCPQSAAYETGLDASKLMQLDAVLAEARAAKAAGATRFCMGAAWRSPKDRDLDAVCAMVEGVRALGLESCATLGMLTQPQAARLAAAGLDYYNHNLDTSPGHYGDIITTRTYQDRLDTLGHVRDAGINVCCGGIVGMGEQVRACDCGGAYYDASGVCEAVSGPRRNVGRSPGLVFSGWRQLHLLWRAAADDAQSGSASGSGIAGAVGDGGGLAATRAAMSQKFLVLFPKRTAFSA